MKKVIKVLLIAVIILIFLCLIDIWISYNWLTVSNFTVTSSKISEPFRIVLISDLHNHEFGSSNAKLVERIQEQSPDLVIIDGDMINGDSENDNVNNGELVPSARSNCTTLPKQEYRLAGWLYRSATALCQRCEPLFR